MVNCAITTFATHLITLTLEKYGELQVVLATQNLPTFMLHHDVNMML
jgi:hypothetical protein